eukprot:NODE_8647_length_349_cov_2.213333_g6889_i0.p2 GENE.NODE_8647_length_349_cov_2.213333_g6889_i0~~NODE_8647_length_349_cov_2.213333_g6889_i0.p2  ORF type:complete len:58 (-),score=3.90 NODE_8647_length_349_cov_2.213333_g6889_i0:149-322(-)
MCGGGESARLPQGGRQRQRLRRNTITDLARSRSYCPFGWRVVAAVGQRCCVAVGEQT